MELVKTEALAIFDVQEAVISDLETAKNLVITDAESEKVVRKYRQSAKSLQVRIEKRRKALNSEYKKRTDEAAAAITARIDVVYLDLDEKVKAVEAIREARRLEKEAADLAEKQRIEAIEAERIAIIETAMAELVTAINAGLQYNLQAKTINEHCIVLSQFEIKESIYQERYNEALAMLDKGIADTQAALYARERFEADQAALEAEKKRIEEERAAFEAELKAAEEKAMAAAIAEKQRQEAIELELKIKEAEKAAAIAQEQETLRQEREAIEKEKAAMLAEKQAKEELEKRAGQYAADWDSAHVENAEFDKARKEKLLADKERAKVIALDKEFLNKIVGDLQPPATESITVFIRTKEAIDIFLEFTNGFESVATKFKAAVENLA